MDTFKVKNLTVVNTIKTVARMYQSKTSAPNNEKEQSWKFLDTLLL